MNNQFALLRQRRFCPLFITQMLGAFNDNLFKTSLSVLVAYEVIDVGTARPEMLVSLAAGLFILPFVLFTPLAGAMADKFDKDRIMRAVKIAEIGIVILAIIALSIGSVSLLLFILFAFGTHSAFFSPSKFSILPQHLTRDELIGGNALVNTGTYVAILLGTILGGLLALSVAGTVAAATLLLFCAVGGYGASRLIPRAPAPVPGLRLDFNPPREAVRIIGYARSRPNGVFPAIIGCAWFYFIGAMLLSQFPNYTRQVLGVDHIVLTFFMTVFSLGVALGGLLNNRLLKSKVEATYVPLAALVLGFFLLDLYFSSNVYAGLPEFFAGQDMIGIGGFLSHWSGWRIVIDLFAVSVAGGIYVVPLKSIIQDRTPLDHSARVLAGSAVMDALFILGSSIVAIIVFALGFHVQHLFILMMAGCLAMAYYLTRALSDEWVRKIQEKMRG